MAKTIKKILFVILLAVWTTASQAQDGINVELLSGMWSKHVKRDRGYIEKHDLVGISVNGFGVASYLNSINKRSYVIFYQPGSLIKYSYVDINLMYMLISGYKYGTVMPAIVPVLSLHYKQVPAYVDVSCVPMVVCSVGFRFKF